MKYGYARVSLETQNLDLQLDALERAGCEKVFYEKISSRKKDRPELKKLLKKLRRGDILVCYKLDRLGRSLVELVGLVAKFEEKGIRFISLVDGIDTTSSSSKLLLNIMMCIADFEREMIRERTIAGLIAAKRRGVKLGRPFGLDVRGKALREKAIRLFRKGKNVSEIHRKLAVSRPTIYKYLQK